MSKKIVVITGSPRKQGNSFAMTEAFVKAAEAKGHHVVRFDTSFMNIGFCHACETCYKSGKACSFDDDFNIIAPAILDADAVVFLVECVELLLNLAVDVLRGLDRDLFTCLNRAIVLVLEAFSKVYAIFPKIAEGNVRAEAKLFIGHKNGV